MNDVDLLAATIIREAALEPPYGQAAVGIVIRNRVNNPRWWGRSFESVILKPWQFSCWNFAIIHGEGEWAVARKIHELRKTSGWHHFTTLAVQIITGRIPDTLMNADHYYNPRIANPSWGDRGVVCDINNHRFLRLEL